MMCYIHAQIHTIHTIEYIQMLNNHSSNRPKRICVCVCVCVCLHMHAYIQAFIHTDARKTAPDDRSPTKRTKYGKRAARKHDTEGKTGMNTCKHAHICVLYAYIYIYILAHTRELSIERYWHVRMVRQINHVHAYMYVHTCKNECVKA
jgi:hypothetical protein